MEWLYRHLRNKLVAGSLAAVPIGIIAYAAWWLEQHTAPLTRQIFGFHFPGFGALLLIAGVYALGVLVTSLAGKWVLGGTDYLLRRIPGVKMLYQVWKDVLVTAPDKPGIFDQVVLVPNREGEGTQIAFTDGRCLGSSNTCCVFVPGVPNPIAGRLVLVDRQMLIPVQVSVEDAFKFLLSTGNFVPPGLAAFKIETGK